MTGSRKKQQKRDDPLSASTYKIIVVGGGGVGKYSLMLISLNRKCRIDLLRLKLMEYLKKQHFPLGF